MKKKLLTCGIVLIIFSGTAPIIIDGNMTAAFAQDKDDRTKKGLFQWHRKAPFDFKKFA